MIETALSSPKKPLIFQVLVYAANGDNHGDFMRLHLLKNKKLELLIDLGSGVSVLSHPSTVEEGIWHDIVILR